MLPRCANTSSDSESLLEAKLYPSEATRRLDRQLFMMPAAPEHHNVTTIAAPNQVPRADERTDPTRAEFLFVGSAIAQIAAGANVGALDVLPAGGRRDGVS